MDFLTLPKQLSTNILPHMRHYMPLHVTGIARLYDLEKAFDSIEHDFLLKHLYELGV